MSDRSEEVLPPLFASWIGALLPGPIPAERAAPCDTCAMLPPTEGAGGVGESFFSPTTKCCTYVPDLSNFLVGRILADGDPDAAHGRATVQARIDRGVGVSPLGLHRTPLYGLLYRTSPASFGHAESMRCPHFVVEGGRCGVWRHRESTCATWFCKHGRGGVGKAFWERLHDTLSVVEDAVRVFCLLEIGIDPSILAELAPTRARSSRVGALTASDVDGKMAPAEYKALWGVWRGRERELFLACAKLADALSWSDVTKLGGTRLALVSRLLMDAYDKLTSDEVPARARLRQLKVIHASQEAAHLVGYSGLDPLRVPKHLVDVLYRFDGRPTREALENIEEIHGLRVTPGTARKLVDFRILEADTEE